MTSAEVSGADLRRLEDRLAVQDEMNAELVKGIRIVQQTQLVLGQHVEALARQLVDVLGQMAALEQRIGAAKQDDGTTKH